MKLDELVDVKPRKLAALRADIERLEIDMSQIEETFTRGSGRGGQKIAKTSSCVILKYPPLELTVRCQKERRRSLNRFLALRELVEKIKQQIDPGSSKKVAEIQKARKKKARKKRRAKKKQD